MSAPEWARQLETKDVKLQGEIAPGVLVFGAVRPMGRIRAYSAAGLSPFAGRGLQQEIHLLGHIHVDGSGKASRVEGFNGAEGERWAQHAHGVLSKADLLAPNAEFRAFTPLRGCPHSGVR